MNNSAKKSAATFDLSSSGPFLPNDTSTCLLRVLEFVAPHSIPNIPDTSNSFSLLLHDFQEKQVLSYVISVPPGGYDTDSLVTAINKSIDTQLSSVYANQNITFSNLQLVFSTTTGKITWTATVGKSYNFTNPIVAVSTAPSPLLSKLGVPPEQTFLFSTNYQANVAVTVKTNTEGTHLANLCYPTCIYISIDNLKANNVYAGTGVDIFDMLPIGGDYVYGDVMHISHYSPFQQQVPHASLKGYITVRLWDEEMQELDWQGQDWILVIGVEWGLDTHSVGLETSNITEMPRPLLFRVPGHDPLNHYQYAHGGRRIT